MLESIKDIYCNKPRCQKYLLFLLLLLLNLVIRLPSIPHEKGYDSFFIHSLANSVSIYGDAQWWVNWLSVFGFYAYSYASGVPFILSGFHQLTSMEMEIVILIYCVITGIISIFTAYLLAGRFSSSFIFKYAVALFFSLSPGIMLFSTWEVSSRGLFIVLLPLFIYLLMSDIQILKKIMLGLMLVVFLFAIHHYAFTLFPIIFVYLVFVALDNTKYLGRINPIFPYVILFMIVVFIGLPFISRSLVDSGSRYGWLITSSITILRQTGPMVVLAVGGFLYTLFKKEKNTRELFLLMILSLFIPAIYSHAYGAYILLLFIVLFMGVAFFNVTKTPSNTKLISSVLILMILSTIIFSGYFNHYRTGDSSEYWYMEDEVYETGLWGRNNIPANSYGLDTAFETERVFAVSEGHPITPTLAAGNLAYGFINESDIQYVEHTYLEKDFYFEGPYSVKPGTTVAGQIEWLRQTASSIGQLEGYEYFVQDKYYTKPVTNVVTRNYNKVYDNPRMAIWQYNH